MNKNLFKTFTIMFVLIVLLCLNGCKKDNDDSDADQNQDQQQPITYVVKFIVDENVVNSQTIEQGKDATAPNDPEKVGYTFTGWDKSFTNVQSNLDVYAEFSKNSYTVTFKVEGEVVKSESVEYGSSAVAPSNPEKVGYTFTGWDKDFTNVKENIEVNAQFEVVQLKVTFKVEGEVVKEQMVDYGTNATAPSNPRKTGYNFKGWDKDYTNVVDSIEVNAVFEKKVFTVKFVDINGKVLSSQKVKYEEAATAPTDVEVEGYEFVEWDKEFSSITSSITITGIYRQKAGFVSYFYEGEELELSPTTYEYGVGLTLPIPEKEGYAFVGWYLSEISLTEYKEIPADATANYEFYARFVEIEKQNPIVLPDATYRFTGTKYGTTWQPILPSEATTGVTNYNWTTSDDSIATVSTWSSITKKQNGYVIITATLKSDPSVTINGVFKLTPDGIELSSAEEANKIEVVTVTFVGKNDEVLSVKQCQKGGVVVPPKAPSYDGLAFDGWDKDYYNINENTTITATYKTGTNKYEGKSFAIIGDSISTCSGYIPDGFAAFYPYPTADVELQNTWWMQTITKLGGTLFVNNSYSGTCVADSSANATKNISRLQHCIINGETPDVILIFMGANDCASKYVTSDAFDAGYKQMIENLQQLCPNSEIVLCTLPDSPFYSEQVEFNNIIVKYAEEYNLKLVDTSSVKLEGHLCDSAHPLASGMKLVADQMVAELLK